MTDGGLRARLRAETAQLHARLHRHPGLRAAASGVIDLDGYRLLLMRLYGFHRAFEASIGAVFPVDEGKARSALLESDLEALGVPAAQWRARPLCAGLPAASCEAEALGALYVVEGSALGGARIAQALRARLLPGGAGCRFFSNDGAPRPAWEILLTRLQAICDPQAESAAIAAALATFQAFENWMEDWASAGGMAAAK
jgi:heme oxygenase